MKNYFKGIDLSDSVVRQHPWTDALYNQSNRYCDFKLEPEKIPEALEDFKPYADYAEVQRFYELIRFINAPDFEFETNDCAFIGPQENTQKEKFPKKLKCSGRLMVLFRDLRLSLSEDSVEWFARVASGKKEISFTPNKYVLWLKEASLEIIGQLFPEAIWNCIAVELFPAFFMEASVFDNEKAGYQVTFHFWAWGDTDAEVMQNLGAVVDALHRTLELLSDNLKEEKQRRAP